MGNEDDDDEFTDLPEIDDDFDFGDPVTELTSSSYSAYSKSATNPNVMFRRPSELLTGILY
jgi:hypothetical protein